MAVNLKGRSFLTLMDFTPSEIRYMLDLAHDLKAKKRAGICNQVLKGKTIVLFVLSFILAMGMGYMSSKDSTLAWVNWAEQSINTVSQLCLMLGTVVLHKAGLKDYTW